MVVLCGAFGCGTASLDAGPDSDEAESEPVAIMPARGIEILAVEVNQGTAVTIDEDGWIDPGERPIGLIAGREALVRVHHGVDPDWIGRAIEARLTLTHEDSIDTLVQVVEVAGASNPAQLEGGFWFELDADQTAAGTRYRLELWETGDPAGLDASERRWASPDVGEAEIGFEAADLAIKVTFVPIQLDAAESTPSLDEQALAPLLDSLYEQNPTTRVEYAVREPILYELPLLDLGDLLPVLSEARTADGAEANVYYHGLVDIGAPSLGGRQGLANIVGADPGEGALRVGVTIYWAANAAIAAETFNHEIGHNQGLSHVMCPTAEADGLEPEYPHINGWIGNWGWGLRRQQLFAPDEAYDYMSYCGPAWVSDWTWQRSAERIATLTSWDMAAPSEPPGELLIGAPTSSGMRWWVARGRLDPGRVPGHERVRVVGDAGEQVDAPIVEVAQGEGSRPWQVVELPLPIDRIVALEHQGDALTTAIPLHAIARP